MRTMLASLSLFAALVRVRLLLLRVGALPRSRAPSARRAWSRALLPVVALLQIGCGAARLHADLASQRDVRVVEGVVDVDRWNGAPIVAALLAVPERPSDPLRVLDHHVLDRPGASFSFLLLPQRHVRVVAFEDDDRDLAYDRGERVSGSTALADVALGAARHELLHLRITADEAVPPIEAAARVVEVGTIRALDDPRMDAESGRRGLWEPMRFVREGRAGLFFLEPYDPTRTPVLFVHGIGGHPSELAPLIARLDRRRFQPWVAAYPSGLEIPLVAAYVDRALDEVVATRRPEALCVVAHSMGGLVMRDALARYAAGAGRARVPLFVTIATPFGGHAGAAIGVAMSPVVVPAWRSLVPGGEFLAHLHDAALPDETRHALFFAAGTHGPASDGVVTIASQRDPAALAEADVVRGFAVTHTGALRDPEPVAALHAELAASCR